MKKIIIPTAIVVLLAVAAAVAVMLLTNKDEYRLIKVHSFEGTVTVEREDDGTLDAFDGMKLIPDDTVNVMEESFLELLADSDKHICAEENTSFVLDSSGTEDDGYITIELLYGKSLFTIDNELSEDSFFDVKTPNATLSVRGTSFSVEYDEETGETTVEVFEGKVWALYYGNEQILEKGDVLHIKPEDFGQVLPVEEPRSAADSEGVDFMISRYFQNVPDYMAAPADILEFYYCSDNSQAAAVVNQSETINPTLSESMQEINSEYIDTVIDKIIEKTNSQITVDYLNNLDFACMTPLDITNWYNDFASRTVTINDTDSEYTFEFTRVTFDWIYSDMTAEYATENYSCLPMSDVNSEGRVYAVTGINLTFYSGANISAGEPLTQTPENPPDSSSSLPENLAASADENLFSISYSYNFSNESAYSSADTISFITVTANSYTEDKKDGVYNPAVTGVGENPPDKSLYEITSNYIEPHRAEIDRFLEKNDAAALKAFEEGAMQSVTNVTEWFPETITLFGSNRGYIFRITSAEMKVMKGVIPVSGAVGVENYPSGYYKDGDEYCYVSGVSFNVMGYME